MLSAKVSELNRVLGLELGADDYLTNVWGYGHSGYEHTVNSHINRLRAKLEEQPEPGRFIHTVWGVGYRFEAAA